MVLRDVSTTGKGSATDAGPLEFGQLLDGEEGKFPATPSWLTD